MDRICQHCKMEIEIRNPSGFCDHLYYPDMCEVCKKANPTELESLRLQVKELEEAIKLLTEEIELVKKAFREDIEVAIQTIKLLQEQNTELTERAESAEEKLKNLINLMNLDMY